MAEQTVEMRGVGKAAMKDMKRVERKVINLGYEPLARSNQLKYASRYYPRRAISRHRQAVRSYPM